MFQSGCNAALQCGVNGNVLTAARAIDHDGLDTLTSQALQQQKNIILTKRHNRRVGIVYQTWPHGFGTGFGPMHVSEESKTRLVMNDLYVRRRRRDWIA